MVSDALRRLRREQQLRASSILSERERARYEEVRHAFFEGMLAGSDQLWMERPPEAYWLESDTRRGLFAGPPRPECPSKRAVLSIRNRGAPYDARRDPGRVVAQPKRRGKSRKR